MFFVFAVLVSVRLAISLRIREESRFTATVISQSYKETNLSLKVSEKKIVELAAMVTVLSAPDLCNDSPSLMEKEAVKPKLQFIGRSFRPFVLQRYSTLKK